ncbi:hypothetical protein Y900_001725 [Mycolicibacterium aromaticivorans JS19b1 = JCM 16368]|uniref:Secreted protein n=1 Tax=Mycolicibacterium aromaticivorans JS19b1 = JCM 16368 TaxID=1440774 RepID=A0A064CDC0_9MYCO|nr:hypothetical protein [Mycolicibacterium aromaticivorans]KDE97686.1 hypothetical protein Y900_001725 [Mycolicibacterium aromaticivorans JS19b1 = JCM 16368]
MNDVDTRLDPRAGRMEIARSRGAASGFLLVLLGLWGALIPFIGPYFDFAYQPDTPWVWTAARGWLEVLPGVVAVLGGLLLLMSRNRATALLGGWLAVIAGAWFVVGRLFAGPWGLGDVGAPVADSTAGQVGIELAFWSGLGALIIFLGAMALGRVSVHSVRDVRYATRPVVAEPVAGEPVDAATTTEPVVEGHHRRVTDVDDVDEEEPRRRRGLRDMLGGSRRTPVAH